MVSQESRRSGLVSVAEMEKMIADYASSLEQAKSSSRTVATYTKALHNGLLPFMVENGHNRIQDLTAEDLEKYRLSLVERNLKPLTIDLYIRAVKYLFRYLEDEGIVFADPSRNLKSPSVRAGIKHVPSHEEMEALLELVHKKDSPVSIRNAAMVEVSVSTGLRLEELTSLTTKSLSLKDGFARVIGKGDKERMVPIGRKAVEALERYMPARDELLKDETSEALWIGKEGDPLTRYAVEMVFKVLDRQVDSARPLTTHAIRRYVATSLLENGANPLLIAELLGHANLKILSRYLRVTLADLKAAHEQSRVGQ